MKKALPLTLILIGAALLITAVVFWIDSSTSAQPESFGKSLRDWLTLILGIGASIKGWMDLFKKEKPTPPTTKIDVKGNNSQISLGDNSPNIQADTYIGTQIVQQPQESKTPKSLNQLPAPPLDFIGREKELVQLHKNIEKGVLISGIQGMGGIGKTALGLKLAEQITSNYPDGQIYLDLRGAHAQTPLTPEQVMAHVIRSFHPETVLPLDFGELGAMYRSVLNGKKVLLFYDNARDEKQLDSLLPPKSCALFVTSRQYFTLPGLVAIDLETLNPIDAVELIQEISPRVDDKDAETLAKLCGYLPLAIRVAVSILSRRLDWSPAELMKKMGDNKAKLGLVESSINLSYESLEPELQKYLQMLCIFTEPFDREVMLAAWFGQVAVDEFDIDVDELSGFSPLKPTLRRITELSERVIKSTNLAFTTDYKNRILGELDRVKNEILHKEKKFGTQELPIEWHLDTIHREEHEILISRLSEIRYQLSAKHFSAKESCTQETEGILDKLLKTSLLKFDQNLERYYFHDLIRFFLEEKYLENDGAGELLMRFVDSSLATLRDLLYAMPYSTIEEGRFVTFHHASRLSTQRGMASTRDSMPPIFYEDKALAKINAILPHCISVFRHNLARLGNHFYTKYLIPMPQNWRVYLVVQTDIVENLTLLNRSVTTVRFARTGMYLPGGTFFGLTANTAKVIKVINDCAFQIDQFKSKYSSLLDMHKK